MAAARPRDVSEKLIASNPSAHQDFTFDEVVEAGLVLTGTEVKSLRQQSPNIKDSFIDVTGKNRGRERAGTLEAWLVGCHIGPYSHGNIYNHETTRRRKLLLHRHQIERIYGAVTRDGMTVIPLRMYFKQGRAKIEIALARGKKKHDKRQDLKQRSADREIDQAMKKRRRTG